MGVDGAFAVVDEEAHLAQPAAPADVAVDIGGRGGRAGALVREVGAHAVRDRLDGRDPLLQGIGLAEVDDRLDAQLLGHLQAGGGAVHRDEVIDARRAQHRDHHQAHRAAALNEHLAAEV